MRRKKPAQYPIIIGLTGSIGMGKSTVTRQFAALGAATCDSDHVVHRLLSKHGAAVKAVGALFPDTLNAGAIDRAKLGKEVFGNLTKLKKLEAIMHPLVRLAQERVIHQARMQKKRFVVLDIPLLFETDAQKRCDIVVVTTAPHVIQKQRVMQRANMTEEKFKRILALQLPDIEKRRFADYIVHTGQGRFVSNLQVKYILAQLTKKTGTIES